MVLRAHLSGPAALESACRAAHDRSKLTCMILELLLIPSAPRNAPGSVTQCQAGCPSFPVPPPLQLILHPQLGQGPVPRDSLAPSGTRSLCPPMAPDPITSMPHLSMRGRVMLSRMRPLCTANLKGNPTPGWLSALCPRVLVPGLVLPHPSESPSDPLCLSFPACKQASSHPCSHGFLHRTRCRRLGCCFYQSGRTPTTIQAELAWFLPPPFPGGSVPSTQLPPADFIDPGTNRWGQPSQGRSGLWGARCAGLYQHRTKPQGCP